MKKLITFGLIILLYTTTNGQGRMIYGKKHSVLLEIPKNWTQVPNEQVPFFIKPDTTGLSELTYMYAYGIDYDINPKLEGWIEGNNNEVLGSFEGVKIDSLKLEFKNIKNEGYTTGRYKVITYEYKNQRKEALLIIECKNSIVTEVLSAENKQIFDIYFPSFIEMGLTMNILGTTLIEKK